MSKLPSEQGKKALEANYSILSSDERHTVDLLCELDQSHLFAGWPPAGTDDQLKHKFLVQVADIENAYLGGIKQYVTRAKQLLQFAMSGGNPYEGYKVSEPQDSVRLEKQQDFDHYEAIGLKHIKSAAFVIVAGGLGERLGYKGIKLALPSDSVTGKTFIQLYIEFVLALQSRARLQTADNTLYLPLAIMTSDDTDKLTRELLNENHNYGMSKEQLIIFKQGKVPSLLDNDAHFCLEENDKYSLDTKPHGHGDVHMLLYQQKIVEKWVKQLNKKHIVFFQDTNGLVFRAIPAALGVSVEKKLEVNSLTVPRVQGDAVGAICRLTRDKAPDSKDTEQLPNTLTINVEYNQLEGLLGKGVKEPLVPGTNYSIYPGNLNVLIFDAVKYLDVLEDKKGIIAEFVNPKYNPDKQSFKKPTRLESMMQDYPKLLKAEAAVGFTQFQRWTSFSAVKNAVADGVAKQKTGNAAEVAATGEADMYLWSYNILTALGCNISKPVKTNFTGIQLDLAPKTIFTPSFGVTQAEIRSKFPHPNQVSIQDPNSCTTLILQGGDIVVNNLTINSGTLIVSAVTDAHVKIDGLTVNNAGWTLEEIKQENSNNIEQKWLVRGFTINKREQEVFIFDKPGRYVLSDQTRAEYSTKDWRHEHKLPVA